MITLLMITKYCISQLTLVEADLKVVAVYDELFMKNLLHNIIFLNKAFQTNILTL